MSYGKVNRRDTSRDEMEVYDPAPYTSKWAWGERPSDCYEYWPECRWAFRRPFAERLKKSSKRAAEGIPGRRVMHRIWEKHYRLFLYGRCAKTRSPYPILPEMLAEIEAFRAAERSAQAEPSEEG